MTATAPPLHEEHPPEGLLVEPSPRVPLGPSPIRAVRSLAVFEGRRLLRQPAFVGGLLLTVLLLWWVGAAGGGLNDDVRDWRVASTAIVLGFVPLGWMTLVAANLGALRSRRHGTAELLETLPVRPRHRTLAHALATTATVPVTIALLAAWFATAMSESDPIGSISPLEAAVAVPIVAGGGVVGVAVARWVPAPVFALAAIVATIFIQSSVGGSLTAPTRWLSFWVEPGHAGLEAMDVRPSGWHLLWVISWVVIMGVVALLRHGWSRPVLVALLGTALVAGLAGWAQLRPIGEQDAVELAAMLHQPEAHQVCRVEGAVTYCAYPEYERLIDRWQPVVEAVLARVPDDGRTLRVAQRVPTVSGNPACGPEPYGNLIPREVRDRIDPAVVWAADGQVHPSLGAVEQLPCGGAEVDWLFTAVQTGAWAVGLPPTPVEGERRCTADSSSRAALALWLGAQAVPDGANHLRGVSASAHHDRAQRLYFVGNPGRPGWNVPPQWGVHWHTADVRAALALLDRPPADVADAVSGHWERLTDPSTPTHELLEVAGLDSNRHRPGSPGNCPDLRA